MFTRSNLLSAAKVAIGILVLAGVGGALRAIWPALSEAVRGADYRWIAAGFGGAVVYRVFNAAGWGLILRALRHPLPLAAGIRLWMVAETMRWLPGSIWGFASRVYQAQRAGVPAAAASLSMPLELAVTVLAWTLVAGSGGLRLVQLSTLLTKHLPTMRPADWAAAVGIALGVCVVAAISLPDTRLWRKAASLFAQLRAALGARPRPGVLLGALIWFGALNLFNGAVFYALLHAFAPPAMPSLATVISINAIGWLAGFFAVFSPGGLGVRETAMTALLTTLVGLPTAVASVVVWRVVQIAAEFICLAACLPFGARAGSRERAMTAVPAGNPAGFPVLTSRG